MRTSQKLALIVLVALVGAAVAGLILTGGSSGVGPPSAGRRTPASRAPPPVDQRPLDTAQSLAALASTPAEQEQARDAERAADREVDLAFTDALRSAREQPSVETGETRELQARVAQIAVDIKNDQDRLKQLTAESERSTASRQTSLKQQIEVGQAELALDQDELGDAQQDLARSGGDTYSRIERLWQEHEASAHNGEASHSVTASSAPSLFSSRSLIGGLHDWMALRAERQPLRAAGQQAAEAAARLAQRHNALEQEVAQERAPKSAAPVAGVTAGEPRAGASSSPAVATSVSSLHHLSNDEKNLADLDQRIEDLQELGSIYTQWEALVSARARSALHNVLRAILWILLAVLVAFAASLLIDRLFERYLLERKQRRTLRAVARFSVEVLVVLVILLVVFGSPSQLSTILGLAGAGLTVALKDFIVSFCGWFVLMGRNGIRAGDWVEINGVRGEVIEIGLLRTVLLETGNWTDAGHPTGRQVAFLNSFAVEGYYFNFSTAGQWLWDQLQVLIPASQDPYPVIEEIRAIVARETAASVQAAEQEWQHVTRRYGVRTVSAAPSVDVKQTDAGVQVVVRYMTRAKERSAVRSRLNHAVVKLLHGGPGLATVGDAPPDLPASGSVPVTVEQTKS